MKTQNKTMTAKQFIDALTQGEIVPNGTEVIAPDDKRLLIQDVRELKHFPGVKITGDLFVIDCPNLETLDPDLTVSNELHLNQCPELVRVHNTKSANVVFWMCPKIVELPELTHEGLVSVRIAGVGCTKISNITAQTEVLFHQCENLVEVSDIHAEELAFAVNPEIGIVNNITVTRELMFNECPKITELPGIGEGNYLDCMMLADTGVQVIPSTYFRTGHDKPIVEHSHVLLLNNPNLQMVPAIVAEELDVLNCPGVSKIPSGTRVNMLLISNWSMKCEPGVIINDKVDIDDNTQTPANVRVDIEDFLNNRVVKPTTSSSESDEEYDILGP